MLDIMIVDDYEVDRKQLKSLQFWKQQTQLKLVEDVSNGIDALKRLRKQHVDILLADIDMQKLGGLELLEQVKQEKLCKCVILMSEAADFECARKGMVLGAFDYMVKPVNNNILGKVLRRAIHFFQEEEQEKRTLDENLEIIVESILDGGSNFDRLIEDLTDKCFRDKESEVDGVISLMNFARDVSKEVIKKYEWIQLLTPDVEEVRKHMLQSGNKEMAVVLFNNYVTELYNAIRFWHPVGMSALSGKAVEYILNHPFDKLTLTDVAEACFVSNTYLSHNFKKDMNKSFVDYVISFKMQIVKKWIAETDMSMIEIAENLGYDDYKYMGRLFKKVCGVTLSEYKRMQTK